MTPEQQVGWQAIVDLLKRPKYRNVHKLYSSAGGFGYITGVLGRTEINYLTPFNVVKDLLDLEHDRLPRNLQSI